MDESSRHDAEGRKLDENEDDVLCDILEQAKPNCVNKVRALGTFEVGMLPGKGREGPSGKVAMLDILTGA